MEEMAAQHPAMAEISANVIYLMGFSFVLGSLFTVFILIILDIMRSRRGGTAGE